MFRHLSIKAKLMVLLLPVVITGLVLLSTIAFWQFSQAIRNQIFANAEKDTNLIADNFNDWLEGRLLECEQAANSPVVRVGNSSKEARDAALEYNKMRLNFYQERFPGERMNIYMAFLDGTADSIYVEDNQLKVVTLPVADMEYYKQIMAGRGAHVSQPSYVKTFQKTTVSVRAPVLDDNRRPIGVIGSIISMELLYSKTAPLKFGEKGFSLLISADGTYMVNPDAEKNMKMKMTEENDEDLKNLGKEMISGKAGVYRYVVKGEKYVAFYQPIPISGWSVASVVSEAELLAPANRVLLTMLVISLVLILLLSVLIYILASHIIAPLRRLIQFADHIAKGELGESI